MKKLSKRESKFRQKIINEFHLKKNKQIALDYFISIKNITYYFLYHNLSFFYDYKIKKLFGSVNETSRAINDVSNIAKRMNLAFDILIDSNKGALI